jgi:hypothetical protein
MPLTTGKKKRLTSRGGKSSLKKERSDPKRSRRPSSKASKKRPPNKGAPSSKKRSSSNKPPRGQPVEESLRFQAFKQPPKSIELTGSKHNLNGKWELIKEFKKGNYEIYVYQMKDLYLTIVHGGYADKLSGEWREKWFWSITGSNPLDSGVVEEYIKTNAWSPKDMLNGGLLKGSHVYRFEFREVREKIKHDDSRDIRMKFGGIWTLAYGGRIRKPKRSKKKSVRK